MASALAIDNVLGIEPLAEGGFGTIYAGLHRNRRQRVVVKVPRADVPLGVARLEHEAAVLQRLRPPAVPELIERGVLADGRPYLVLERLDGDPLAAELGAPLEPARVRRLVDAILIALEAVHAAGVIHRDLTPANIVIDGDAARLLDFGLAHAADRTQRLTPEGSCAGTAAYMAPEQCDGSLGDDARSDLYSLGVIWFEMLTGALPFTGSRAEVLASHLTRRPPRPSRRVTIDAGTEQLVLDCLAKRPGERPASAAALRAALASAAGPAGLASALASRDAPVVRGAATTTRRMVTAWLRAPGDIGELTRAVAMHRGALAHGSGEHAVLVFDASDGVPLHDAVECAESLTRDGLATAARVEVMPIVERRRADGSRALWSRSFAATGHYPRSDERGVRIVPGDDAPLAAAPLVGRDDELTALASDALDTLRAGGRGLATVIGSTGIGKSALARALVARLAIEADAEILSVTARSRSQTTLDALLAACFGLERPTGDPAQALCSKLGLAAHDWAPVALALGWIDPSDPALRATRAAPGALTALAARAIAGALTARSAGRPIALILDDAEHADRLALDAIELATLPEAGGRIWACVLAGPQLEQQRPAWGHRAARATRVELPPLADAAAVELCRRWLLPVEDVPARAVEQLVRRTGNNPLLLRELIAGLRREGLVRPDGSGYQLATDAIASVPDVLAFDWLAARELAALPPELADHARLASLLGARFDVLGLRFDEALVVAVLDRLTSDDADGAFPLDARAADERLVTRGLLVRTPDGCLAFRHPLLAEAIARSVPPELAVRVHAAAYACCTSPEPRARHAAGAGLRREAITAFVELGDAARQQHRYLEAERFFSAALDQDAASDRELGARALHGRGLMRYRLGRYGDATRDLEQAIALTDPGAARATLWLDLATAYDWAGDLASAESLVDRASAAIGDDADAALRARLHAARGRAAMRHTRSAEARDELREAVRLAGDAGDDEWETWAGSSVMLGYVEALLGDRAAAHAVFDDAIARCRARGDLLHLATAYNNRTLLAVTEANGDAALANQREHVRLARELGMWTLEQYGTYNLAVLCYQLGELAAAQAHAREVFAIEQRHRQRSPLGVATWLLEGRILMARGEPAAARRVVEAIPEDALALPFMATQWQMLELLTRDATDAEWDALVERAAAATPEELIDLHDLRAQLLALRGRPADAHAEWQRALALVDRWPNLSRARLARTAERYSSRTDSR